MLIATALTTHQYLDHTRRFQEARRLLMEGHETTAEAALSSLGGSRWVGGDVEVVLSLTRALTGSPSTPRPLDAAALREQGSHLLLFSTFREGRFDACERLAQLVADSGDPEGRIFLSAVRIEEANYVESLAILKEIPAVGRTSWLAERLFEAHDLLARNTLTVVEDRRGTRVGSITTEGRFEPASPELATLLPVQTIESLCRNEQSRSVRLTLDVALSRLAREALGAYRGSVVLTDPFTGGILAAVTDTRTRKREGDAPFTQLLEPASVSKLLTTTASLRAGVPVDEAVAHMHCRGAQRYDGEYLYCPYRAGALSGLREALAISCNIAFANLGTRLGWMGMAEELSLFGFGRPAAEGVRFGYVHPGHDGLRALADLSIGLEVSDISPVHASLLAAVFGNGGEWIDPSLVLARDGLLRLSPRLAPPSPRRGIVDPNWLGELREAMEAVALSGGTAGGVAPDTFRVAMKTGTAATPGRGYHTNYVGFGPLPDVEIAFAVRVTNQRNSKNVRYASYRVTQRLLRALDRHRELLGVPLIDQPSSWEISQGEEPLTPVSTAG